MALGIPTRISVPVLFLFCVNVRAEQDMQALVKELVTQVKELKEQVAHSNARIAELEQTIKSDGGENSSSASINVRKPQTLSADSSMLPNDGDAKPVVTAGDIKGTIKVPGTDTSIGIGGFVKLDTLFSSSGMAQDTYGNQRLEVAEIPIGGLTPGNDDQISLHAKESRFWFKSYTPSQWGDINTYLELDFYGDPKLGTYIPRLRHAYGTFGRLLAGQTWTTFLNSQALADTLDNGNVGAILSLRKPQIRWTQPFTIESTPMEWQFALEAPLSRVWDAANDRVSTTRSSHYPDLVARLNLLPTWGNLSLSMLGRQAQYTPAAVNRGKSVWGGAVNLSGKVNTFDADNLRFMLAYGNAMGRYGPSSFFADAAVDDNGNMELIPIYAGMLAYQHWWDKAWRSTFAYGISHADLPAYAAAANRHMQTVHANLLWNPISQATIGVEYIYGMRELGDGQNGELHRVQFSTRFNF